MELGGGGGLHEKVTLTGNLKRRGGTCWLDTGGGRVGSEGRRCGKTQTGKDKSASAHVRRGQPHAEVGTSREFRTGGIHTGAEDKHGCQMYCISSTLSDIQGLANGYLLKHPTNNYYVL